MRGDGELLDLQKNPEKQLLIAEMAATAIVNEGGFVSGQANTIFSYAMTGQPELQRGIEESSRPFAEFRKGLRELTRQFTARSVDTPFISGICNSGYRLPRTESEIPYHVFVRGRGPYTLFSDGGWGLPYAQTSLSYGVKICPVTNEVVGTVVARNCISVGVPDLLGDEEQMPVRSIHRASTERSDVVLHEARRAMDALPDVMPTIKPAKFGLDIFGDEGTREFSGYDFEEALIKAVRIAQHRGDYSTMPY